MADGTVIYGLTTIDTSTNSGAKVIGSDGLSYILLGGPYVRGDTDPMYIYNITGPSKINIADNNANGSQGWQATPTVFKSLNSTVLNVNRTTGAVSLGSASNVVVSATSASMAWSTINTSSYSFYIDEVTGQLKGQVRYSNGTTGLCTLCSITT